MLLIDKNTPTSTLLEINKDHHIGNKKGVNGTVEKVEISNDDAFWLFLFHLTDGNLIEIKKMKNIC
ncbi:hypothetical protein [Pedobacter sp. Leaf176]|uniref:hypothetical protein n=1 Tax=Pedobacter sp. Leaf176 TaxID=1736286 RepID=UPI0006F353F4|nr:hypothetical protein [Pedobacter sp. Leaf176]KQR70993.1 hypothetical protein ASF92_06225 [Pedobacter sp. Leaf176]